MSWIEDKLGGIAGLTGLTPSVVLVVGLVFAGLVVGSVARIVHRHRLPPEQAASLLRRLRTWWIIAIVLAVSLVLGRAGVVVLLAAASVLALREYLALLPPPGLDRRVLAWAYVAVPLQYLWTYLGWYALFLTFIPIWAFLGLTARIVLLARPDGFLRAAGSLHWGMLILVFCLSHAAYLLALPVETNPAGGAVGWFLYLVILTELNDIMQAIWGRALGRRKVIAAVSPGKSWEGLIGGAVTRVIAAILLAPLLTPLDGPPRILRGDMPALSWLWPALAGVVIAAAGFIGDITMSALKRDCHVKDSGRLLPGQGGILDRIDSLTFTAPIFFHLVRLLYA